MKRSGLFSVLCAFTAILIFAGTALSASRRQTEAAKDTITLEGKFTITADLPGMKLKDTDINRKADIPMPTILKVETQDDHPEVLAQLFRENGYIRRRADVFLKMSEPVKVSGAKVIDVYEIRFVKGKNRLELIRGKTIPAKTGEYYIGIKLTPREEREIEDAAILKYVKIRVEKVKPARPARRK